MADESRFAPEGKIWVCMACGKMSKDKYGLDDPSRSPGWDESCMLNSNLLDFDRLVLSQGKSRVLEILPEDGSRIIKNAK